MDVRDMNYHLSLERQHYPNTTAMEEQNQLPQIMPNQNHKRHRRCWHVNQMDDVQDDSEDRDQPFKCIKSADIFPGKSNEGMKILRYHQTRNTPTEKEDFTMNEEDRTNGNSHCNQDKPQLINNQQVTLTPSKHHHHNTTDHFERQVNQPSQRCRPSTTTHECCNDIGMGSLKKKSHTYTITTDLRRRVFITLFVYAILNHLSNSQHHHDIYQSKTIFDVAQRQISRIFPLPITGVAALVQPTGK